MRIRLLIVDDHILVRQGIRRLLADLDDIDVVGEAGDGPEAITLARELKPNLVLMDLLLPTMSGLDAARSIKQEVPDVDVVFLTVSDEDDDIYQAIAAGGKGYIVKSTDHAEMVRQIRQAALGEIAIPPAMVSKLAMSIHRNSEVRSSTLAPQHEPLTPREREVLTHIAQGLRNKEIAASLSISNNTVRAHVRSLMRKLELENRAQLAAYAVRHKLV